MQIEYRSVSGRMIKRDSVYDSNIPRVGDELTLKDLEGVTLYKVEVIRWGYGSNVIAILSEARESPCEDMYRLMYSIRDKKKGLRFEHSNSQVRLSDVPVEGDYLRNVELYKVVKREIRLVGKEARRNGELSTIVVHIESAEETEKKSLWRRFCEWLQA